MTSRFYAEVDAQSCSQWLWSQPPARGNRTAPINGWTDRQDGTSAHSGILRSHEKEQGTDTGAQSRVCAAPGDLIYVTPQLSLSPASRPRSAPAAELRVPAPGPPLPWLLRHLHSGRGSGWVVPPLPQPSPPPRLAPVGPHPTELPAFPARSTSPLPSCVRGHRAPPGSPACRLLDAAEDSQAAAGWLGGFRAAVASWEHRLRSQGTGQPLPCLSPVWDPRIQKGQKDL